MPIAIAPTGSAGLAWHEGEIALARAAAAAGIPFALATGSMTALERVAEEAAARCGFRSILPDRSPRTSWWSAQGPPAEALLVTVDSRYSQREYNLRNGMTCRSFTGAT
jgi:isopentenyl diphosphate isomerase/L-lactate dehydrogenase-like FMN-dependent dehydrogenase